MVSIIPGMENLAPLRTETSSGSVGAPSLRFISVSSRCSADSISWSISAGRLPFRSTNRLQAAVETVKPGGTGSPALVISASPAPLPPSRSFMSLLPSALPPPKK